jgi:hypothetical protein
MDRAGLIDDGMMGVAAAYRGTTDTTRVFDGAGFDLLGTADKCLAPLLRQSSKLMRLVDFLQQEVNAIGQPRQNRMSVQPIIVSVAVQNEDSRIAAREDEFFLDGDAQQMGNDFGRSVVVAADPGNLDPVG